MSLLGNGGGPPGGWACVAVPVGDSESRAWWRGRPVVGVAGGRVEQRARLTERVGGLPADLAPVPEYLMEEYPGSPTRERAGSEHGFVHAEEEHQARCD